jgi:2',3'-cyclic-nucleotide 2'-phosphodiesterase (5'-nucleotidase family)
MRRAVRALAAVLVALVGVAASPEGRLHVPERKLHVPERKLHVIVLHTNDVHGQVLPRPATWTSEKEPRLAGGLPRVAAYVNRVRTEAREEGASVLLVDAGDWCQGTPEGSVEDGLGFARALSKLGYDAMCVGNHEFDRGLANLKRMIGETGMHAVCANLVDRVTDERVDWVQPYRIVERDGLRIGIVGLVTPATPEITHKDAQTIAFVSPARALAEVRAELAERVDWVLPITHLSVEYDRALAKAHPDLSLIVGGHSHTYLKEGVREGQTLIVQTGSKASAVGRVDIWFEPDPWRVAEIRARVVDLLEEPHADHRNADVDSICRALTAKSDEEMKVVVGELTGPLLRAKHPLESSTAGNWIADALRSYTKADVGLMNRGGIRCDLPAGPLTRRDLFEISPFDNVVSVLTLSGEDLESMLRRAVEGQAHSGLEISGLELDVSSSEKRKRRLHGVRVGEKPLDRKASYKVAMNSFMADGGDAYLEKRDGARIDEPVLIREMLESVVREARRVDPDASNRYRVSSR